MNARSSSPGLSIRLYSGSMFSGADEELGVEEREADLVAGRVDDRVDRLDRAVGEAHAVAEQLGDVALGDRVAGAEAPEQLAGDGRVGVEEVVVGRRQPEVLHAPGEDPRQRAGEPPLDARRQPRVGLDDLVGGLAEDVLRHDPRAGAGRQEDRVGDGLAAELGDDVDGGVADPDDEHALAVEVERSARVDVVVRVDRRTVEGAGEVGVARVPVMAVADEQRVEALPSRRRPA